MAKVGGGSYELNGGLLPQAMAIPTRAEMETWRERRMTAMIWLLAVIATFLQNLVYRLDDRAGTVPVRHSQGFEVTLELQAPLVCWQEVNSGQIGRASCRERV